MASINLGEAYVQVIPSAQGISGKITELLGGEAGQAGTAAGSLFGGNLANMAKKVLASAAIGKTLQKITEDGMAFESTMAKASTLFTGSEEQWAGLNQQILQLSSSTGMAATTLAEAAYSAESAGVSMEDLGTMLDGSSKLAIAGFTDVDTALSATAKTMNAYGLSGEEAMEKVQRVLIQTQNKGITTVGELGATLAQVTPTAAAFGVEFEQVGAALAGMTAQGTPTAQATTQLNSLIAELGKNGTTAAKNLMKAAEGTEYAGMSFNEMMDAGLDLNDVLGMMQGLADKNGLAMVDMFSSIEAGKAAMSITNSDWLANMEAMATEADVVGEAYSRMADTLSMKKDMLTEGFKNLGITIFQGFSEGLGNIFDLGNEAISLLQQGLTSGGPEGFGEAAGQVIANLLIAIGENFPKMLATGLEVVAHFISGIIRSLPTILQAGVTMIVNLVTGIINMDPEVTNAIQGILGDFLQVITNTLDKILAAGASIVNKLVSGIKSKISSVTTEAQNIINKVKAKFEGFSWSSIGSNIISGIASGIRNGVNSIVNAAKDAAQSAFNAAKNVLGISSPSKAFYYLGQMTTAGFVNALYSGENAVSMASHAMSDAAFDAFDRTAGARFTADYSASNVRSAGSSGFVQNITINSPTELTPSEVARQTRIATQQMVLRLNGV